MYLYKSSAIYLLVIVCVSSPFSPDTSSFDAYGLKLNYALSCTIVYNDSNQYVYAVSVQSRATSMDRMRFVFIGTLTYTGMRGDIYVATVKPSRKTIFPCVGWRTDEYRIHPFEQFVSDGSEGNINNDFFVVTIG